MPNTDAGKAVTSRSALADPEGATTHGLFARDVVLPSLGEDPEGYRQLEAEWLAHLQPRNLLERHCVEKIAAASWRLRRLHRWQAQIFEDDTLTEAECLDRLDKALRHETALHRQIDTAVKMLAKDAPHLFAQPTHEQVLEDTRIAEREYRDEPGEASAVDLEVQNRLYRIRNWIQQALNELSVIPIDAAPAEVVEEEICENELPPAEAAPPQAGHVAEAATPETASGDDGETQKCENELVPFYYDPLLPRPAPADRVSGPGPMERGRATPGAARLASLPFPRRVTPDGRIGGG